MNRVYWVGCEITAMKHNQVFVFGSNPEGRHGAGSAKQALQWGALWGKGRGLSGSTYALVTKNLTKGFTESSTGIKYRKYGGIRYNLLLENIRELYTCANLNKGKQFLIPYKIGDNNLNGYTTEFLVTLFSKFEIPENIVFHESIKALL